MTVIIFNNDKLYIGADSIVQSIDFGDGKKCTNNAITPDKVTMESIEATVYYIPSTSPPQKTFKAKVGQDFTSDVTININDGGPTDKYLIATGPGGL